MPLAVHSRIRCGIRVVTHAWPQNCLSNFAGITSAFTGPVQLRSTSKPARERAPCAMHCYPVAIRVSHVIATERAIPQNNCTTMPMRCSVCNHLTHNSIAKQMMATKKPVGATLLVAYTAFRQSHVSAISLPTTATSQTAIDVSINNSLLRHANAITAIVA